jgi:hypothetical protein
MEAADFYREGAASKMTLKPGNLPFRQLLAPPWNGAQRPDGIQHIIQSVLSPCPFFPVTGAFHFQEFIHDAHDIHMAEVRKTEATLRAMKTPVIIVSIEVGMGIVPEHRLGRIFHDIAGRANQ